MLSRSSSRQRISSHSHLCRVKKVDEQTVLCFVIVFVVKGGEYALYQPISKREICLDIVKNKAKVRDHQVNGMLLELAYLNNYKTFHRGFSDQSTKPCEQYKIVFTG